MSLVTDGKIHSMAANDNYRDNFEGIFGNAEVKQLKAEAYRQYAEDGLVDLSVIARLDELGIDVTLFT